MHKKNIVGKNCAVYFSTLSRTRYMHTEITGGGYFFYLGCYLSELFSLHFLEKIMVQFFFAGGKKGRGTNSTLTHIIILSVRKG